MANKTLIGVIVGLTFLIISCYVTSITAFPQNPNTHDYFLKICNMPYIVTNGPHPETFWTNGGDCDDRATIFADYLKSKGATNVQICTAYKFNSSENFTFNYNKTEGHAFIVWDNKVYSPTNDINHRFYDVDIKTYQQFLKNTYGYNMWYWENDTTIYF